MIITPPAPPPVLTDILRWTWITWIHLGFLLPVVLSRPLKISTTGFHRFNVLSVTQWTGFEVLKETEPTPNHRRGIVLSSSTIGWIMTTILTKKYVGVCYERTGHLFNHMPSITLDWLFYISPDIKWLISETFPQTNLLEKIKLNKSTHPPTNRKVLQHKINTQKGPL